MAAHDTSAWLEPPQSRYSLGLSSSLSLPDVHAGKSYGRQAKVEREIARRHRAEPSGEAKRALQKMVDHLVERKSSLNLLFRTFDTDGSGAPWLSLQVQTATATVAWWALAEAPPPAGSIDLDELHRAMQTVGLRLSREDRG
jgi:hypothetical protein